VLTLRKLKLSRTVRQDVFLTTNELEWASLSLSTEAGLGGLRGRIVF
jgi:hypothetical protein